MNALRMPCVKMDLVSLTETAPNASVPILFAPPFMSA